MVETGADVTNSYFEMHCLTNVNSCMFTPSFSCPNLFLNLYAWYVDLSVVASIKCRTTAFLPGDFNIVCMFTAFNII